MSSQWKLETLCGSGGEGDTWDEEWNSCSNEFFHKFLVAMGVYFIPTKANKHPETVTF
jgi:hypothetical protein